MTSDNPAQQDRLASPKPRVDAKLAELKQTIDLRQNAGPAATLGVVQSNRGKDEMDAIRAEVSAMFRPDIEPFPELVRRTAGSVTALARNPSQMALPSIVARIGLGVTLMKWSTTRSTRSTSAETVAPTVILGRPFKESENRSS